MFRRAKKLDADIPQPPTKEDILSDLETFYIAQAMSTERNSRSDGGVPDGTDNNSGTLANNSFSDENSIGNSSSTAVVAASPADPWWSRFDHFLNDIDQLKNYREYLKYKKNDLSDLDSFITVKVNDMSDKIKRNMEAAKRSIKDEVDEWTMK